MVGLPPAEARVLSALFDAAGEPQPAPALIAAANIRPASLLSLISELRSAMEPEAIDTLPGEQPSGRRPDGRFAATPGYRLTEGGMAECRAALASFGEEVRAA